MITKLLVRTLGPQAALKCLKGRWPLGSRLALGSHLLHLSSNPPPLLLLLAQASSVPSVVAFKSCCGPAALASSPAVQTNGLKTF